jgi:chromosome segregation ATPase
LPRSLHDYKQSIQNLIRAKESALTQARAASAAQSQEGPLRAELSHWAKKYEQTVADLEESRRKCALLQGELDHARIQLSKSKSDKAKVERELRAAKNAAALQLAQQSRSSDEFAAAGEGADNSELEFYKGRTSALNVKLTRLGAVVAEKDRQIDEMRRQLDRYQMMGHHKLHGNTGSNGGGAGGAGSSKSH